MDFGRRSKVAAWQRRHRAVSGAAMFVFQISWLPETTGRCLWQVVYSPSSLNDMEM